MVSRVLRRLAVALVPPQKPLDGNAYAQQLIETFDVAALRSARCTMPNQVSSCVVRNGTNECMHTHHTHFRLCVSVCVCGMSVKYSQLLLGEGRSDPVHRVRRHPAHGAAAVHDPLAA